MLKKKMTALLLALCMLASLTTSAFAATPRATVPPTTYPKDASYYNVEQPWTCSQFTYSSYFFEGGSLRNQFDCFAGQQFKVEFRRTNGTLIETVEAGYNSHEGYWHVQYFPATDFYVVIRNMVSGTPINDGAFYIVRK